MDTSKEYIAMCDCPEMQEWRITHYIEGDYFVDKDSLSMELVGKQTVCIATHNLPHSTTTWLPRQDQLQEIMEWENNIPTEVVWKLRQFHEYYDPPPCMSTKYYKSQPPNYTLQFTTMEQLWLAFVMKEKYNKIWDKDNWITT